MTLSIIVSNPVLLSVEIFIVMLSLIVLSVLCFLAILSGIMLSVVMQSVVAPKLKNYLSYSSSLLPQTKMH